MAAPQTPKASPHATPWSPSCVCAQKKREQGLGGTFVGQLALPRQPAWAPAHGVVKEAWGPACRLYARDFTRGWSRPMRASRCRAQPQRPGAEGQPSSSRFLRGAPSGVHWDHPEAWGRLRAHGSWVSRAPASRCQLVAPMGAARKCSKVWTGECASAT